MSVPATRPQVLDFFGMPIVMGQRLEKRREMSYTKGG